MPKLHLGFLASHGGSNVQAIIDACKSGMLYAEPCCIISNNSKSYVLERAEKEGIPHYHVSSTTYPTQEEIDNAIIELFGKHNVDTVVLAGYMKKIGDKLLNHFQGRVLNIHPALLPKFGGKGMYGKFVHEAVIKSGEKFSGPTIHLVDNKYDNGRILSQNKIPVLPDDTIDSLASRVLKQEHIIYAETLQKIATGEIIL